MMFALIFFVCPVYGNNINYGPAAGKAGDALALQIGLTHELDLAMRAVDQNLANFINAETMFNANDVYFAAGTAYSVGVRKEIMSRFENPFVKGLRHTITFGLNSKAFSCEFPL
jgi:hypothetical protein